MIILAGDMALKAGVALGCTERGLLASTLIDVTKARRGGLAFAAKAMSWKVVLFVEASLAKGERVCQLAYEEPTNTKSTNRLPQYAMITALLMAGNTCGVNGDPTRLWPSSIKKRFTGSGKASKGDVITKASQYAGRQLLDDNEADAIALLAVVLEDLNSPK